MTFRVNRACSGGAVVLTFSGDIAGDHSAELQVLVGAERDQPLVLDLANASIVDRAGVLLLARAETDGATLRNCPAYVREWIDREEQAVTQVARTASERTFHTAEGLQILFRVWQPTEQPRAVLCIVPGFNSHSGYYAWVAEELTSAGLAVLAVDLRGRGKSDGERFYITKFSDYVDDVAGMVNAAKSTYSGVPLFLMGHSAGGVVACLYALNHQGELAGLICESFAFQVPAPDFALAVFKGLSHIAPHAHVLRLKNEDFSRDPETVRRMNADPLIAHETQPTQTLAEMVRADEQLQTSLANITLPVLILHGTADKATKPAGSQFFYDASQSSDKTLKLYDGYFHDPLNDVGKEIVVADITSWINARLPDSAKLVR